LIQIEVIIQWYLKASKKNQRILDEDDFVNGVLESYELLEEANE